MAESPKQRKTDRLDVRVTPQERRLLEKAAKLKHKNISGFVLESAYEAAHEVLAEQAHFELSPEQWEAFNAALSSPPKTIPALRKLMSEPSVFEKS